MQTVGSGRLLGRLLMLVIAGALVMSGCSDDGASVRTIGTESGSDTIIPPGSELATGSGSTSGSASGLEEGPACKPVGIELEPDAIIDVTITDGDIELSADEVEAGTVRFEVTNAGDEPHELLVVFSATPQELPLEDEGGVDESGITENTVVGEVTIFPAGTTCPGVFDLPDGQYVLFCNVVEPDGQNASHFENGETAQLTVTGL